MSVSAITLLGCLTLIQGINLDGIRDTPVSQQAAHFVGPDQGLPAGGAESVALLADGTPVVATGEGVYRNAGEGWTAMDALPDHPVTRLYTCQGALYASGGGNLSVWEDFTWATLPTPMTDEIMGVYSWGENVAVLGGNVLATLDGTVRIQASQTAPWTAAAYVGAATVPGIERPATGFLASDDGLFAIVETEDGLALEPLHPAAGDDAWAPRRVRALCWEDDALWFAAANGVGRLRDGAWTLFTGKNGLPLNTFTGAAAAGDGALWFGTERGAVHYDGEWHYRASRRWLPGDQVNGIAIGGDGAVWFATDGGVGRIRTTAMRLADKAAHYERIVAKRHVREDLLVTACRLETPGDLSTAYLTDGDNDGGHTSKYATAQCFAYAATGDPAAKARADRGLRSLRFLVDLTPMDGFPARTFLPVEGSEDPNLRYDEAFNLRRQERDPKWKNILPRWPVSEDGNYYWKCDTSSDEIISHMLFLDAYYHYAAETPEEKAAARQLVQEIMDHIVDNGFRLVDHDGKPTRWANWSPAWLNTRHSWADRGLKSMQILAFLKTAAAITGDAKFEEAADYLCETHHYHINAMRGRAAFPPAWVAPWDDNQAFSCYYMLLRHETEPGRLAHYRFSLFRNALFVQQHNDPFYSMVLLSLLENVTEEDIADALGRDALAEPQVILDRAVTNLRRFPMSLVSWTMKNTHRLDVVRDPAPGQRAGLGWGHDGQALPVDERARLALNQSHLDLDRGAGGKVERVGVAFLLPYYMARYHGLLE